MRSRWHSPWCCGTPFKEYDWRGRILVLAAAAFFCAYCLVWAGIDRERYLLPITTLWLPFCVYEVDRWRKRARRTWTRYACLAVAAVNLPLFAANLIHSGIVIQKRHGLGERFYADENPAWSNPDLDKLVAWLRSNVGKNDVLCLENPFLINYETGRPAVVLPEQIAPDDFAKFLAEYGVTCWAQNTTTPSAMHINWKTCSARSNTRGAIEVGRCGTYHVWRLRIPGQARIGLNRRHDDYSIADMNLPGRVGLKEARNYGRLSTKINCA